jgi:antitoxin MazE
MNFFCSIFKRENSYNFVITINDEVPMEVSVIKIGNSKGIRLSKTLLERYGIRDSVDLTMDKDRIILKPISKPRKGWEKAFREMANNEDDRLLIDDVFEDENLEEWK